MFFALELIGAIANKVNPDFRARELDYILRFSGQPRFRLPRASSRVSTTSRWRKALRQSIPGLAHVIIAGGAADGTLDLDEGTPRVPADRARATGCA